MWCETRLNAVCILSVCAVRMLRSLDSAHTSLQLSRLWSKELLQTTVNTEHDLPLILSQTSDGFYIRLFTLSHIEWATVTNTASCCYCAFYEIWFMNLVLQQNVCFPLTQRRIVNKETLMCNKLPFLLPRLHKTCGAVH